MDSDRERELIVLLKDIKARLWWVCVWLFIIMCAVCEMASKQGG